MTLRPVVPPRRRCICHLGALTLLGCLGSLCCFKVTFRLNQPSTMSSFSCCQTFYTLCLPAPSLSVSLSLPHCLPLSLFFLDFSLMISAVGSLLTRYYYYRNAFLHVPVFSCVNTNIFIFTHICTYLARAFLCLSDLAGTFSVPHLDPETPTPLCTHHREDAEMGRGCPQAPQPSYIQASQQCGPSR